MIVTNNEKECQILRKAGIEIKKTGKTTIVCPRCGKAIIRESDEFGLTICCEDKNCIGLIFRK